MDNEILNLEESPSTESTTSSPTDDLNYSDTKLNPLILDLHHLTHKKMNPQEQTTGYKIKKIIKKRRKKSSQRSSSKNQPSSTESDDSSVDPKTSVDDTTPEQFFDAHGSYIGLQGSANPAVPAVPATVAQADILKVQSEQESKAPLPNIPESSPTIQSSLITQKPVVSDRKSLQ